MSSFDPKALGMGGDAFACHEYNDRAYDDRGWCVFEDAVSREFLGRSRKSGNEAMRDVMDVPKRAKLYEISSTADPVAADDAVAGPQASAGVQRKIENAKFIGKGDGKVVLDMYKRFQLDGATIASKIAAGKGGSMAHGVAARQTLAEEQRAAKLAQKREDDANLKKKAAARTGVRG